MVAGAVMRVNRSAHPAQLTVFARRAYNRLF
jgi:hypothetical protein